MGHIYVSKRFACDYVQKDLNLIYILAIKLLSSKGYPI